MHWGGLGAAGESERRGGHLVLLTASPGLSFPPSPPSPLGLLAHLEHRPLGLLHLLLGLLRDLETLSVTGLCECMCGEGEEVGEGWGCQAHTRQSYSNALQKSRTESESPPTCIPPPPSSHSSRPTSARPWGRGVVAAGKQVPEGAGNREQIR